ncbi:hypothetical protein F5Y07DRAFT_407108 [Xylaria sp. FL0933]|nr:hypothetical protein F5Y07DRAFT_407108 [Xylaria sp. FL0933]
MAEPQRTPDSRIFGVRARDITSRVPRFNFLPSAQVAIMDHVRNHQAPGTLYNDINELLVRLDLNGFENITNAEGKNVHNIIVRKVKSKISSARLSYALIEVNVPGENNNASDWDSGYDS